ncbi:hypothetical protein LSH36_41g03025 [Paralvinella palmiformis]|uniref:Uncharacterized protein n=1 Tax=Paralvinella palmiformis TaxID=53620 RepID=A0AAD9K6X7_9ANNE|nr:hypothetical protein LSH36_41g03025 [Paralvinella palmiformis]
MHMAPHTKRNTSAFILISILTVSRMWSKHFVEQVLPSGRELWMRNWVPIAIGIALSLSLLIIFMAIMLLFLHKRKRRQPVSSETNPAVPIAPPPYEEPLPFIVYNGHVGNMVMFNNDQAAPIPNKADPSSISIPVPPYSEDASLAVHGQESRCNEAVDTGYFGASGSGVTASHETEDEAVETIDKPEDDLSALHRFNSTTSDITGINNPTYEELDAVGYFGTTSPSK